MKKILPIMLVLCILCSIFVSCKDDTPPTTVPNNGGGVEPTPTQKNELGFEFLPEKDLEQYNWRLLMIDNEAATIFETEEEAAKGGVVSQAYFERDAWMMERYNITMESIAGGSGAINTWILTNCMAGDDLYDIGVLHTTEQMAGVMTSDLTYDIKELPYVDLTKPYYNQQANKEYTVLGKQVMMNGDYPCCGGSFSWFLFNKNYMTELGLEYPYQIILDGDWTMEVFYEYCQNAYQDIDEVGGKSAGDKFGYAGCCPTTLFAGMGATLTTKDENGAIMPSIANAFNEQRYAKIIEFMSQEWCYSEKELDHNKNMYGTIQWFEGRTLFHHFQRYNTDLLKIETFDYGLAALPKYDEDQEEYYAPAAGGVTIISANIRDPEKVGYILEAFGQITYDLLRPALVEDLREHRMLRDSESLEVYKLLQNHMVFSITKNVDPSNVLASDQIVYDCLVADRPSLSAYARDLEGMIKNYYTRFYYGS